MFPGRYVELDYFVVDVSMGFGYKEGFLNDCNKSSLHLSAIHVP